MVARLPGKFNDYYLRLSAGLPFQEGREALLEPSNVFGFTFPNYEDTPPELLQCLLLRRVPRLISGELREPVI
jgi:hypothetical protein